jgi:hypothetical protein
MVSSEFLLWMGPSLQDSMCVSMEGDHAHEHNEECMPLTCFEEMIVPDFFFYEWHGEVAHGGEVPRKISFYSHHHG